MRISDWSSDVCSSDLRDPDPHERLGEGRERDGNDGDEREGEEPRARNRHLSRDVETAEDTAEGRIGIEAFDLGLGLEDDAEIGRASGRERVWQNGTISVVAG